MQHGAAILLSLALLTPRAAQAQASTENAPPASPYDRGAVSIEFDLGGLVEAWNLNVEREWVLDVSGSVWWAFRDSMALGVQVYHARIFQDAPKNAFLQGLYPFLFRWRFLDRAPWHLFMEGGLGISWSDFPTPPNGTAFNYLAEGSGGIGRQVGRNVQVLGAFRLLHLSNNGRKGNSTNPDLDALGGFGGVLVTF
jgi:hypothetical protein